MKKLNVLLVMISLGLGINAFGQQPTEAEMAAMMGNMMPGEVHKFMAESVGEWTATMKMYMDPSQPPMETTTKIKEEMILGGRYLVGKYSGNMMGMPFEGISTMGYDNGINKFYSSWIDNMGTGMTLMEGYWKVPNKVIELYGVSQDPMEGKEIIMRQTLEFVDADTHKMTMYMVHNGIEMKGIEIVATRNK